MRPSSDVDLLVRESDVDRALAVLADHGLQPVDDAARAAYHRRHHYHVSAANADRSTYVELHFHAHRAWGALIASDELLDRSTTTELGDGHVVRVLTPEDELLYLAVHYAKHYALNLRLLYDLKLFLRRHPMLDATLVRERAERAGTRRALGFALGDLERALGIAPPDGIALPRPGIRHAALGLIRGAEPLGRRIAPARTALEVLAGAVMADSMSKSARWLAESAGRIARRRVQRTFPWFTPARWSG